MNRWKDFTTADKRVATKRGVTLAVLAFMFAMVPQILFSPGWAAVLCVLLSLWRLYISSSSKEPPNSYIVSLVGVLGMVGVLISYNGVDTSVRATVALSILVACRNLQSRHVSQFASSMVLLPLIPMGFFLQENPDWYVAYSLGLFWLLLTTTLEFWNSRLATTALIKRGGLYVLAGLPLLILMFYFMPRPGGIWKHQQRAPSTGMSNTLTPGSISKLAKSEGLAFTVTMPKPVPSSEMYWRGAVLRAYDGYTWRETSKNLSKWSITTTGEQTSYNVVIPDSANGFRYVLEHSSAVSPLEDAPNTFRLNGGGVLTSPAQSFVMYKAQGGSKNKLTSAPTEQDLAVPNNVHPQTNELIVELTKNSKSPAQFVDRARQWIQTNSFVYSLEPGVMDDDWMDTFLFDRRKGFCEHYASTLAYMLRKAGHPARVVAGYQGADAPGKNSVFSVPQAAAHAWIEYWDAAKNHWVSVDPTTWVAPERLMPFGWNESERILLAHEKDSSLLGKFKYYSVHFSSQWNRWVANYDAAEQRSIFKKLNQGSLKNAYLVAVGLVVVVMCWVLRVHLILSRSPTTALMRLTRRINGVGVQTLAGETPLEVIEKAALRHPKHRMLLETWYGQYAKQAYADEKGKHLGLATTWLLLKLPYTSTHAAHSLYRWCMIRSASLLGKHNK